MVRGGGSVASFEIFTPHYLYRSRARPTIRSVPEVIAWGEQFDVGTAQALSIHSVVLMRLASPQHSTDSDVRASSGWAMRRADTSQGSPDGKGH
jgi:hypothetical protein